MPPHFIYINRGAAPFTGLLDLYPNANLAYGLRRLTVNYTGSLIRVRRSSDNAELDIGFDSNNDLDTTSLLSFAGSDSAYVVKMYNQSGVAYTSDARGRTASEQPRIVNSGTLETLNGMPTMYFDGIDNQFIVDQGTGTSLPANYASDLSTFQTVQINGFTTAGRLFSHYKTSTKRNFEFRQLTNTSGVMQYLDGNTPSSNTFSSSAITTTSMSCLGFDRIAGTSIQIYQNNTQISNNTHNLVDAYIGAIYIMGDLSSAFNTEGYLSESILYTSNQNSNRNNIYLNQKSYYGF